MGHPVSRAPLHAEGLHRDHPDCSTGSGAQQEEAPSCPWDCSTLTTGEWEIPLQSHWKLCYKKRSLVVNQAEVPQTSWWSPAGPRAPHGHMALIYLFLWVSFLLICKDSNMDIVLLLALRQWGFFWQLPCCTTSNVKKSTYQSVSALIALLPALASFRIDSKTMAKHIHCI